MSVTACTENNLRYVADVEARMAQYLRELRLDE